MKHSKTHATKLLAASLLVAIAAPALAQVADREVNQERRVIQGERSGELTRGEATRLQNQQNRIDNRAALDRAKNGGALTPGEKARLNARENKASANIVNDKHNDRVR